MDGLARHVDEAHRALRQGSPEAAVRRRLPVPIADEAIGLARTRLAARQRFPHADRLYFDPDGLRYATPEVVAEARAARVAPHASRIADVACGAGIQLAFLARRMDAVGVERDARRAGYARRNLAALGASASVYVGDALDPATVAAVGRVDAVFCDPARAPAEPERTFDGLAPDPRAVVKAYVGVEAFAFELPPQMPPARIQTEIPGEVEYTSLGFALNRACLYTGPLAKAARSALALPSGARLMAADTPPPGAPSATRVDAFLHEIDPAVVAAGLVPDLSVAASGLEILAGDGRRTLGTSSARLASAFLRSHDVLDVVEGPMDALEDRLRRVKAGHVTLRFPVPPAEYWAVRRRLEAASGGGDRSVHVFRVAHRWVVAAA